MTKRGIEVTWTRGGSGVIVETDGRFAVVESDTPAAPGTPLVGQTSSPEARYEIKVRSCRRLSEAPVRYRVDGRFVNLSGRQRQALLDELGPDQHDPEL